MKRRTMIDWMVLSIVVVIALIVIALSFGNTVKLANLLHLNPHLTAGLVEILFATLLLIRGRQRALQRNVPAFLSAGYWTSLAFVTAVNMWGLGQEQPVIGLVVGLVISGAMWMMETTLVWLWTESHEPYKKSIWERKQEAKKEIQEQQEIRRIEWMKWEAKKPNLSLIKEARRVEVKRREIIGDGLPEFFLQQQEAEKIEKPQGVTPNPIVVETGEEQKGDIIPMRQIGFQAATKKAHPPRFMPNNEKREKAIQTAKQMTKLLGRVPTKKELMSEGISEHYSKFALKQIKQNCIG